MGIIKAILVFALGFTISVPSSMVGLGGGFFIVPILTLIFQLPTRNAIAVSLVAMCGTTFSATVGYIRRRRVDYKLGLLYDVLDIPGVIVGAYITTLLPSNLLMGICGAFIVFISINLLRRKESACLEGEMRVKGETGGWRRRIIDSSGQEFKYAVRKPFYALISSFLGGLITGLSGLGGGTIDASTMILLGIPPHIAAASSEFAMAVTNGTGVVAHGLLNNILIEYAIPIVMGTVTGAQIGCLLSKRVKGSFLRKILSFVAFLVGLRLLYSLFTP